MRAAFFHALYVLLAVFLTPLAVVRAAPADDQYAVAAGHYARGNWALAVEEFESFLGNFASDPRSAQARFFQAEALVQTGNFKLARTRFSEFLAAEPNHANARQAQFRKGEAAFMDGDLDSAAHELTKFREGHADDALNAYVLAYLGEISIQKGDGDAAEKYYKEGLQKYGTGPQADEMRFGLGRAAERKGDSAEAVRIYKSMVENRTSPLADDAQLQLATLYYRQREFANADIMLAPFETTFAQSELKTRARYWRGLSQLGQQNWKGARELLSLALRDAPRDSLAPAITYYLGESFRQEGQSEEASARYKQVLANWPESGWADDCSFSLMLLSFQAGDVAELPQKASEFRRGYPKSDLLSKVQRLEGRGLLKQGKFAEAAELLEQSQLTMDGSEDSASGYYIALAQLGQQQFEKAQETLSRVKPTDEQSDLASAVALARASAYIGLKQYGPAAELLEAFLRLRPDSPEAPKAMADLATSRAMLNQFPEAKRQMAALAKAYPQSELVAPTQLHVANLAFAAGEIKTAQELFTLVSRPGNPKHLVEEAISGLAWCQFKAGSLEESASTFAKLQAEYPNSPLVAEAALVRARALEQSDKPDAALATYKLVIEKFARSPQFGGAVLGALRMHERLKQDREAAELAKSIVDAHPNFEPLDALLYEWAWALVDLQKPNDADVIFERLHREFPNSRYWADATFRLAEKAAKAQQFDQAREWAGEIVNAKSGGDVLPNALYLLGQISVNRGSWSEVKEPMSRLAAEYPEHPLALAAEYWVAETSYREGKFDVAAREFASVGLKAGARKDAWLAMVSLRTAQLYFQKKQFAEARQLAEGIASRFPNFRQQYEADYLIGRCYASEAKFDEARVAYENATRSTTGNKTETAAMAQWMIGESFFHQKRYADAIKAYSRAEILYDYPQWQAAALLQTGKCYEMLGEGSQAITAYERMLTKYGQSEYAADAKNLLTELKRKMQSGNAP